MSNTLALTKALVARPSITPDDQGCQIFIAEKLQSLGFEITHLPFGDVNNLWARRGHQAPLWVFLGHTDVVPAGPETQWRFPPFVPTEHDDHLYGRGVADMKSNIAAMITACERFIQQFPDHPGSIAFLLTSDEEGPAENGTVKVMEYLHQHHIHIDGCLVGEPSSGEQLGDTLKIGRRGSLSFQLIIHGKQGHIAYPQLADNAIHRSLPALIELIQQSWDKGNEHFPATSLQFSNIHAGTGATNVIPGHMIIDGNFRYSSEVTAELLQQRLEKILQQHKIHYQLHWKHGGKPFLTSPGKLVKSCIAAIQEQQQITPILSTTGGTSDGRFVAPYGVEVVELGIANATIHQIDERVKIADIDALSTLYEKILGKLLG